MTREDLIRKLTSRKFWIAVAAALASIGAGLAGIADPTVCAVLAVASGAIYQFCEAYVDGQDRKSSISTCATTIEAKTGDRDTVQAYLNSLGALEPMGRDNG